MDWYRVGWDYVLDISVIVLSRCVRWCWGDDIVGVTFIFIGGSSHFWLSSSLRLLVVVERGGFIVVVVVGVGFIARCYWDYLIVIVFISHYYYYYCQYSYY